MSGDLLTWLVFALGGVLLGMFLLGLWLLRDSCAALLGLCLLVAWSIYRVMT